MIYWLLASILFGVVSGALYTWMSPRRERRLPLMLRSMAIYTVLGMVVVYIISLFV
ncbi:MAG: hypothetical protein K2L44_09040 [Duncaniella sp.]|nr:hypothetical protein [Duncaniella sp.]MDE6572003.1 hypothetical protein [Duncaniella sp.]